MRKLNKELAEAERALQKARLGRGRLECKLEDASEIEGTLAETNVVLKETAVALQEVGGALVVAGQVLTDIHVLIKKRDDARLGGLAPNARLWKETLDARAEIRETTRRLSTTIGVVQAPDDKTPPSTVNPVSGVLFHASDSELVMHQKICEESREESCGRRHGTRDKEAEEHEVFGANRQQLNASGARPQTIREGQADDPLTFTPTRLPCSLLGLTSTWGPSLHALTHAVMLQFGHVFRRMIQRMNPEDFRRTQAMIDDRHHDVWQYGGFERTHVLPRSTRSAQCTVLRRMVTCSS